MMNAVPAQPTIGLGVWFIVAAGIIALIVFAGVWISYYRWSASPWLGDQLNAPFHVWDWLFGAAAPAAAETPAPAAPVVPPMHWCFVGEDYTGRWCVKVPSRSACSADRTYTSQEECTLIEANHEPTGIILNGGAAMRPLASVPIQ